MALEPVPVPGPIGTFFSFLLPNVFAGSGLQINNPEVAIAQAERKLADPRLGQADVNRQEKIIRVSRAIIAARPPPIVSQPPTPGVPPRVQPSPPPAKIQPGQPSPTAREPAQATPSSPYYAAITGKDIVAKGARKTFERFGPILRRIIPALEARAGPIGVALAIASYAIPRIVDILQSRAIARKMAEQDAQINEWRMWRRAPSFPKPRLPQLPAPPKSPTPHARVAAPPRKAPLSSSQAAKVLLGEIRVSRTRLPTPRARPRVGTIQQPLPGVAKPMPAGVKFVFDVLLPQIAQAAIRGRPSVSISGLVPSTPTPTPTVPGIPPGIDPGSFLQNSGYLQPSLFVQPSTGQGQCECAPKKKKRQKPRTVCYEGKFRQTRKRTIQTSRKEIPCR